MSQVEGEPHVRYIGHQPVIRPRLNASAPRVAEDLLEGLRTAHVPDVSDAVGALYTMDAGIRPLDGAMPRLLGQALTVKAPPGDNLTIHGALAMVQPGDVLVVDWRGHVAGCATGASSLVVPMTRGLRGAVVDGAWRDVAELRALQFPICARGLAAFSPPKDRVGEINVPVSCGGVVVSPGDLVVGDEEGVVVVPQAEAREVLAAVGGYAGPKALEDYNLADLERGVDERRRYFERALERAGGSLPG